MASSFKRRLLQMARSIIPTSLPHVDNETSPFTPSYLPDRIASHVVDSQAAFRLPAVSTDVSSASSSHSPLLGSKRLLAKTSSPSETCFGVFSVSACTLLLHY